MMRKYLLILFVLVIVACKTKQAEVLDETHELPDSFVEFYIQFHTDSVYQMDHIIFPLQGMPQIDSTMTREYLKNFKWQKEDWVIHKNISESDGYFKKEFTDFSGIISERIYHQNNSFEMTRRFAKIQDEWHLIYYSDLNRI